MKIRVDCVPYTLNFKFLAGTSRGTMKQKLTYFLRITDCGGNSPAAFGEIPFFNGLSPETLEQHEIQLQRLKAVQSEEELKEFKACSSIRFGVDMVLRERETGIPGLYFPSKFTEGMSSLTINGLIWMGSFSEMKRRIDEKLKENFTCIKIKIGAVDWDDEIKLIKYIRAKRGNDVTVRVDANGAFSPDNCFQRLDELAALNVHSIEQPIRQGNWTIMASLCKATPLPIALDEELIGLDRGDVRNELLNFIKPQFIVLKPALCYGFEGAEDWIRRAEERHIGWWITSALESSVGLNAISQFTGAVNPRIPQGLGTGNLYTNNLESPLSLSGHTLRFTGPSDIYTQQLNLLFKN